MIGLPDTRPTDFRAVEESIARIGTPEGIGQFYRQVIDRYTALNDRYLFSESFAADYVFAQIDSNWAIRDRELFGIPVGVKDVFNTKVLPTAMGSEIWKGFKAGNHARVVDEIADRGAIIFAKTTTAEFAVHYIQAGKTVNPHSAAHITGTSSAGSAVAVACGALPIALGTQTAGSIVRPASFCGVYGFKPSFGAFDRTGTLKTTDTLDTIGLLGSDIYGLRKTFLSAFQKETQYPIAGNYFSHLRAFRAKSRLKVGVVTDQYRGYAHYEDCVKADFDAALGALTRAPIDLEALRGADFINDVHALHEQIYCKALSYYFQSEFKRGGGMSEIMTRMIETGSRVSVDDYVHALKRQPELRAQFDRVMSAYDFLVTPSTASPAPLIDERERDDTCLIWTFFGYPVLSIPAFRSSLGLPFGLQIVGPKFSDLALLDFGDRIVSELTASSH